MHCQLPYFYVLLQRDSYGRDKAVTDGSSISVEGSASKHTHARMHNTQNTEDAEF